MARRRTTRGLLKPLMVLGIVERDSVLVREHAVVGRGEARRGRVHRGVVLPRRAGSCSTRSPGGRASGPAASSRASPIQSPAAT